METHEIRALRRAAVLRFAAGALLLAACFFLPAGTLRYWEAWLYLVALLTPVAFVGRYLLRNDPDLLRQRFTMREERKTQGAIQRVGAVVWLAVFLLPGFDERFGWSAVPPPLVVAGAAGVVGGYLLFFRTIRANSWAARTVRIQEGQAVITAGPYARIRHPMYAAVLAIVWATPLALGSYWALIPGLLTLPILVVRIRDEERMLVAELPGYREYAERTRYRLVPGIW